MPSIRILYDVDGWAYHNRALALGKYAPADFEVSIARQSGPDKGAALGDREVDLVLAISLPAVPATAQAIRERGWRTKLVGSSNAGWPRQIALFYRAYSVVDGLVINNAITFERLGRLPRTWLLQNGVDLDVFRVQVPLAERKPKVLWTASQFQRGLKGFPHLVLPMEEALRKAGIDCELLLVDSYGTEKLSAAQMADWYNTGTVLVCASDGEGTPNPALEAAACGCTIVSTAVGNMPELIRDGENGFLVERNVEALVAAARAACEQYPRLAANMQKDIQAWSWEKRAARYYDAFRELLREPEPPELPDISRDVTVFVSTVGAPSYDACLANLGAQDAKFALRVIDRVAPMSAAFQRMIDECTTPYFVQVDEDMLLYPHAVRTLHERIAAAPSDVGFLHGDLHDVHLEHDIVGVKIYRHDVVRRYPFVNAQSFEKLQARQLKADGFRIVPAVGPDGVRDPPLGLHGTHYTNASIYERYATLERRRRRHPRELAWFGAYPAKFLGRFLEDPSALHFHALMGALSGAVPRLDTLGDKDFRAYAALPGFAAAGALFKALVAAPSVLHEDLECALAETRAEPVAIEAVDRPDSPRGQPGVFRLRLADGRQLKGRVLSGPNRAARVAYLLARLDHPALPKLLYRRGRALLLEWIEGEPVDAEDAGAALEECARLHAWLHGVRVPEGCPYPFNELPSVAAKLDSDLAILCERAIVAEADVRLARDAARHFQPSLCALGVVHRDLCPENLVWRATGGLGAIDNESLSLGPREFDLARTWYRWPMRRDERQRYFDAYGAHHDVGQFLRHFPFWAIAVLADSAALRLDTAPEVLGVPVERLRRVIAALRRNAAPEELVFE